MEQESHPSWELFEAKKAVRAPGVALYGAAVDAQMTLAEVPVDEPVWVVLGNEKDGLSRSAREACRALFRIPMFGMSESLNVSVAAGMILSVLVEKRRQRFGGGGDLNAARRTWLEARYAGLSLEHRLVMRVLEKA